MRNQLIFSYFFIFCILFWIFTFAKWFGTTVGILVSFHVNFLLIYILCWETFLHFDIPYLIGVASLIEQRGCVRSEVRGHWGGFGGREGGGRSCHGHVISGEPAIYASSTAPRPLVLTIHKLTLHDHLFIVWYFYVLCNLSWPNYSPTDNSSKLVPWRLG